jgi:hypothetical protein
MRSSAACLLSLALLLPAAVRGEPQGLDGLLARMASTRGVAARFHERREVELLVEPLESRGNLYFVPPDRMARFTTEPAFSSLIVQKDSVRFREAEGAESVDLSGSPMARAFVDNFMAIFGGDREKLLRAYRAELTEQDGAWELTLTPLHPPLARFLERVVLRGDGAGMREMEVRDVDGDRTLTAFEAVEVDRPFSAAELARLFDDGAPLAPAQ